MICELADNHRLLTNRQKAAFERGDGGNRGRMQMKDAASVGSSRVNRRVQNIAGQIDAKTRAALIEDGAIDVDFYERSGAHFAIQNAERIDEKLAAAAAAVA